MDNRMRRNGTKNRKETREINETEWKRERGVIGKTKGIKAQRAQKR